MERKLIMAIEYARMANRSPRTVQKWAADGKVKNVKKIGKYWFATFEDWEEAAKNGRGPYRTRVRGRRDRLWVRA